MIKKRVFVHIPYNELIENLAKVEEEDFNIEMCLSGEMLDSYPSEETNRILSIFKNQNRDCTFHAPYRDLNPGSFDKTIREVTLRRFYQTLEIAAQFEPQVIVFHTGFDSRRYFGLEEQWLKFSLQSWEEMLKKAKGISAALALENVFESQPHQLYRIIKECNPSLNFCLDVGHHNVFSPQPLKNWFDLLGEFLVEVHLHDNNGQADEHLAIGQGNFPFDELASLLKQYHSSPLLTIEGRDEAAIRESLGNISNYFI